jgi:hypothetical protein
MTTTATESQPPISWNPESWKPAEYKDKYYPSDDVGSENGPLIEGLVDIWRKIHSDDLIRACRARSNDAPPWDLAIVGGGGVMWDVPSAVPHVREICYTDPFSDNLAQARYVLSNEYDTYWDAYVAHTLRSEGETNVTPEQIRERSRMMRERITRVDIGDVCNPPVVPSAPTGCPVVSAHFVLEAISPSKAVWLSYLKNLHAAVMPGGALIISSVVEGKQWFPGTAAAPPEPLLRLVEGDFRWGMEMIGLEIFHLRLIEAMPENKPDYEKLIICAGWDKSVRRAP